MMTDWRDIFAPIGVPVTWDEHEAAALGTAALITPPTVTLDTRSYVTLTWRIYLVVIAATREGATGQALDMIRRLADNGDAPDRAEPVVLTAPGATYSAYQLTFTTA